MNQCPTTVALGGALMIFVITLLYYIYTSFCLMHIARKAGVEPAWWAWVPVANLFLMCKIAALNYRWILAFLLGFVPILGVLVGVGLSGYIWYKIALALKKPGWLGILVVLPVLGVIPLAYLAFTE